MLNSTLTELRLHDASTAIVARHTITTQWQGNRNATTRKTLAQAESFYGFLAYPDGDSEAGLFFACGREAVEAAQAMLHLIDWHTGACSCEYRDPQRRIRTAVFTLNPVLGGKLSNDRLFVTDADKAFRLAFGA